MFLAGGCLIPVLLGGEGTPNSSTRPRAASVLRSLNRNLVSEWPQGILPIDELIL